MTGSTTGSRSTQWLPTGTRLNDTYELDQGIASGGMGEIYRGHNIQTGSVYAIKMIRSDFAETDGAMTMFLREAGALNDLFHEAIVRYFAFSVDPTLRRPYMVMEFVTGRSLSEIVKSGPMDYEDVRILGMRLAAGLQVAHDRGIIHRDIAPDNILVPDGDVSRAKIIDFGIARQTQAADGTIIGDGFAGKYNYVSPEQLGMFGGDVGAASDIYSLGLLLVEALAGRSLNMRGNQFEVIDKRRTVPDLRHIDVRMQPLLTEMLQPDPADRPGSMTEVAAKLRLRGTTPPQVATDFAVGDATVIQTRREPGRTSGFEPGRMGDQPREPSGRGSAPHYTPPDPSAGATVFEDPRSPSWRGTPFPRNETPSATPSRQPTEDSRVHRPPTGREPVRPVDTARVTAGPMPAPAQQAFSPGAPKASGGKGGLIAAALALVLLAGGGGGYWVWQNQVSQQKTEQQTQLQGQQTGTNQTTANGQPTTANAGGPGTGAETPATRVNPALNRQVDLERFLATYPGGSCFFATPIVVSDSQLVAEGFGHSIAPFERLDQDFRQKTGLEADIRLRQVVDAQCPVVDFLARTRVDGASRPKVEVYQTAVKAGDPIVGAAKAPTGFYVTVMLVADDGSVTFLAHSDKPDGTSVPFQAAAQRLTGGGGKPGLIVAIASPHPLDLSGLAGQTYAGQILDKLNSDAGARGERLASAAQYLVVQR